MICQPMTSIYFHDVFFDIAIKTTYLTISMTSMIEGLFNLGQKHCIIILIIIIVYIFIILYYK